MFEPSSRYYQLETARLRLPDGREVVYVRRRFLPLPADLTMAGVTTRDDGERLDHLAARVLGDPELFWRLCDANGVIDPAELEAELDRPIIIPTPPYPGERS